MMINSSLLPNDSIKHDDFSNTLENFNDINNNNNSIDCNNTMKQDSLSLNDTTLLTTTTTTTVEVKVKTTSRKRKLNIINDNNNKQQTVRKKKVKYLRKIIQPHKIEKGNSISTSFFTHTASPRDNDILMCACVCSSYLLFSVDIYSRTAALFLLLVLSAICRRTILIFKRQNKCVNLSIDLFNLFFYFYFKEKTMCDKNR